LIAVDTNILARYYLDDDPEQAELAQSLIEFHPIYIPKTVVLELEWVLRGVAKVEKDRIVCCLEHLLSLPNAEIEQRDRMVRALAYYQAGFDFADMLHWVASENQPLFMTFDDRKFARRSHRLDGLPAVRVLDTAALEVAKQTLSKVGRLDG
jgi:predicted nucleic-acid-binding protein